MNILKQNLSFEKVNTGQLTFYASNEGKSKCTAENSYVLIKSSYYWQFILKNIYVSYLDAMLKIH